MVGELFDVEGAYLSKEVALLIVIQGRPVEEKVERIDGAELLLRSMESDH